MKIELERHSLEAKQPLVVGVSVPPPSDFDQMDVDIWTAGVPNPKFVGGMGSTPTRPSSERYELTVTINQLSHGIYEVRVRLSHADGELGSAKVALFAPQTEYDRCFFEVRESSRPVSNADLLKEVAAANAMHEYDFLEPVHATLGTTAQRGEVHTAFVFVRGLLLGTHMRFKHFEVTPTKEGLDTKDMLDCVNSFLLKRTTTGIQFTYEESLKSNSRQGNPVSVFHFPAVVAGDPIEVKAYAESLTELTLLAFSLTRDASGTIFDTVVVRNNQAVKYARSQQYVGNQLTGWLAGESSETIATFTARLKQSEFHRFLVRLYKEARQEPTADFQYVRLWQILEILAESKNYDSTAPLLAYDGSPMMDGDTRRCTRGAVNIVFALLRDAGIGSTEQTWKHVNVWFARRTAVAHHGSMERFQELTRPAVRAWAQTARDECRAAGHDSYLWNLKEDVKLLLMRKLGEG